MRSQDILSMKGGHKIAEDGTAYANTDYHFHGFIPHADITITNLVMGATDISASVSGLTYKQGIYYGMPSGVGPGYGTEITTSGGDAVLVLTLDSPTKY